MQQSARTVDSLYGLKLFVTKRSTKDDLPTPVSPSRTTLTSRGFSSGAFILTESSRNETLIEDNFDNTEESWHFQIVTAAQLRMFRGGCFRHFGLASRL